MVKHGNKKGFLRRGINLGKPGEPARELIESYERKYGKMKTSKLIRGMIVRELSRKKEFDEYKKRQLIEERIEIQKKMKNEQEKLLKNSDKLEKLGIDVLSL